MKHLSHLIWFSLLFLMGAAAFSQTETAKTRNFTVTFCPLELGGLIPLKNGKDNSLPPPIYAFTHKKKPNIHANAFRLGLIYKSKYGIEAFYNFSMGFQYESSGIEDYLARSYPNYESPKISRIVNPNYNADWKGWQAALFYRIRLGRFYIEPKFQLGFEKYSQGNAAYYLKEKGSNQFIEYFINVDKQNVMTPSFHYILNTSWMLNPTSEKIKFELGLKVEYLVMNVNLNYTVTRSSYGLPDNLERYKVKQHTNALILALYMKMRY
jgi:hypothetical protein